VQTDIHFWSYLSQFFLEWEMFQTKVVGKIKTHILCSVTFFRKSCRLWDNGEKCPEEGQGHRRQYGACALHAGYLRLQIHTLALRNTHLLFPTTMVAWTRLDVHCLCCNVFRSRAMAAVLYRVLSTRILQCTEMWQRFRTGCWEWQFDLSCKKWENRNSFATNFALHKILFGWNDGRRGVWGIAREMPFTDLLGRVCFEVCIRNVKRFHKMVPVCWSDNRLLAVQKFCLVTLIHCLFQHRTAKPPHYHRICIQ
jgi:hypothetical protein